MGSTLSEKLSTITEFKKSRKSSQMGLLLKVIFNVTQLILNNGLIHENAISWTIIDGPYKWWTKVHLPS